MVRKETRPEKHRVLGSLKGSEDSAGHEKKVTSQCSCVMIFHRLHVGIEMLDSCTGFGVLLSKWVEESQTGVRLLRAKGVFSNEPWNLSKITENKVE